MVTIKDCIDLTVKRCNESLAEELRRPKNFDAMKPFRVPFHLHLVSTAEKAALIEKLLKEPLMLELLLQPENRRKLLRLLKPRRKKNPSTSSVPPKPTSPPNRKPLKP